MSIYIYIYIYLYLSEYYIFIAFEQFVFNIVILFQQPVFFWLFKYLHIL